MYLQRLSLVNFKNYAEADLRFTTRINCFVGDNGVGKTNLLDAIHYLSLCKSYFNGTDVQNIKYDCPCFIIQGYFSRDEQEEEIYCAVLPGKKKQFKRNKKDYPKMADHIGLLPVVVISPYDSTLIIDGSEERRRFLNTVISQYDKEYLNLLIRYNNTLMQRNKLLKDAANSGRLDDDTLSVYDEQLSQYGTRIFERRSDFIKDVLPIFNTYYTQISGERENIELIYSSQLQKHSLLKLLQNNREKDRVLEYTTSGIHKDDLIMTLGGHSLKTAGSQGQQKTFLTALKFAEFDFIRNKQGIKPILLLDDIFDKFDKSRVEQIMRIVSEDHFGQIFITDTNHQHLKDVLGNIALDHRFFEVTDGKINEI